jgi:hypothetical protein
VRSVRNALLALSAVTACLAFAASAAANTYCVPNGGGLGCTNAAALGLQSALDAAATNSGPDTVRIAAGSFLPANCSSAGFTASGNVGNELTITGAGTGQTVITCPANYNTNSSYRRILQTSGSVTLSGLEIRLPAGVNGRGLELDTAAIADGVAVTADPASSGAIAVIMIGGTIRRSQVLVGAAQVSEAVSGDDGSIIDQDTLVASNQGVSISGAPGATVTQSVIRAPNGIFTQNNATVRDTAIDLGASGSAGLQAQNNTGLPLVLDARNVSISGGDPSFSVGMDVQAHGAGQTTGSLTDSVIRGPLHPLAREAFSTGSSDVTTGYDDYPAGSYAGTGPGTTTENGPVLTADPGFVNAAGGDLHLGPSSPLIDAATPGALSAGEPATDPDGHPRILDGNGDCIARRDIGAYEFSLATLRATAGAPAAAAQSQPVAFHATSCPVDPATTVSFRWTFDDGGTAIGADVSHPFATAGVHHASLALADGTGRTGGASVAVTITQSATSTGPPSAPALSAPHASPNRFADRQHLRGGRLRLGATVSYDDSQAAISTLTVTGTLPGISHGGACVPVPRHLPLHARRCRRAVRFGSLAHHDRAGRNQLAFTGRLGGHLLAAGRYRLTLIAQLNGRTSRPVGIGFTIIR